MNSTIFTIIVAAFPGILGVFLAQRFSVYALVPVIFVFIVLAAVGSVIYGSSLYADLITLALGLVSLQFGYFLGLSVLRAKRTIVDSSGLRPAQRQGEQQGLFSGRSSNVRPADRGKVNSRVQ